MRLQCDTLLGLVQDFSTNVRDIGSREVMEMMLITQYFDMLKDVGSSNRSATVFIPHQPGGIADIGSQIRAGFLQANAAHTPHTDRTT
jgi:hypothetical protein